MIKIISYNIHSGKNMWMVPQLNKLVHFFQKEKPDILAVQEIHENYKLGRQLSFFEEQLKMNVHFGPHVPVGEGHYGIATLTRYPILNNKHYLLPKIREQRGFLDTVVIIENKEVHLLNTHLGLRFQNRKLQLLKIQEYLRQLTSPFLLMGDFNTDHPEIPLDFVRDSAKEMQKEHLVTMMLSNKRIDYVFASKDFQILDYQVKPVKMSDHYPVVTEVTFNN